MDLVLIVSLNGLEQNEVIDTLVGRRINLDSEPVFLNENINWYAGFSSGDSGFRRIEKRSSIREEADLKTKWARNVWEKSSYGISYHVVTEEEARKLIQTKGYCTSDEDIKE